MLYSQVGLKTDLCGRSCWPRK